MANSRTVSVKLSAQVQEYISGMKEAADKTREVGSEGEKLAQQRQAFQQLGGTMLAVGGAITAVGAAALKTGIEYNTLQQTSRAALTTLLGSAQAANEQMDKLDAFAKTSPFAKQTFITAQQQMLAFGIETQKVIPYLDAIQNAVAAAGGSNSDIAELAEIFGKIRATSKITAIDLQQFGRRGVDAASIIGSAMGKTGAQIRDEITAGTLDAGEALDALAEGMADQFAGASANVKETFAGAMDRVKAAWRDFSAELAKPLVDPNGGGALVDLLNWTADMMRAFERLPEPVKNTTTAIVGVTGVALLAGGTFLLAVPKIVAFKEALDTLNITAGSVGSTVGVLGVIIAGVHLSGKAQAWVDDLRRVTVASDELLSSLRDTGSATEELMRGLTGGNPLRGLGFDAEIANGHLYNMNTTVGRLQASFESSWLGKGLTGISTFGLGGQLGKVKTQIEELDEALASLVESGHTEEAVAGFEEFSDMAEKAGWSVEEIEAVLPKYTNAVESATSANEEHNEVLDETPSAVDEAKAAYDDYTASVNRLVEELSKATDELNVLNGINQNAESQNARLMKTYDDVATSIAKAMEGAEGYSLSLDENTVEGSKNRAMLSDMAAQSQKTAQAFLEQESTTMSATDAVSNYRGRLEEGREKLIDFAVQMGMSEKAAKEFADQIHRVPSEKETKLLLDNSAAKEALDDHLWKLSNIPSYKQTVIETVRRETGAARNEVIAAYNDMGGLYSGGVEYFADGGIPVGMYKGGQTLYGFAEPGVPWEAFISGKPEAKSRSKEIWVETGQRLGLLSGGVSQSVPDIYVQNPFTGEYLLSEVDRVAGERVARASRSVSAGALNRELGF